MEGPGRKGVKRQEGSAHPLSSPVYNLYTVCDTRQTVTAIAERFKKMNFSIFQRRVITCIFQQLWMSFLCGNVVSFAAFCTLQIPVCAI